MFQLNAPLFITWFQIIVSLVILFLLSFLGDKYPWIDKFPAFSIELKIARQVRILATAHLATGIEANSNLHEGNSVYPGGGKYFPPNRVSCSGSSHAIFCLNRLISKDLLLLINYSIFS